MNSNLTPEQRVDKNGRLVIRHVRADVGSNSVASVIPAPALSPTKPVESTHKHSDFEENNRKNNAEFTPVLMGAEDFDVFSRLIEFGSATDDEGDSRVYASQVMIKAGNVGGAKTLVGYIEGNEWDASDHIDAFNIWFKAMEDDVIDRNHDYYSNPEDKAYYEYLVNTLVSLSDDDENGMPMQELLDEVLDKESLQSIARIYDLTGGDVEPSEIARFYYEREDTIDVDAYMEYRSAISPVRNGAL